MRIQVLIDGRPVSAAATTSVERTAVLDGVTVRSGRNNPLDQPQPSSFSATISAPNSETARHLLSTLQTGKRIDLICEMEVENQPVTPFPLSSSNTHLSRGRLTNGLLETEEGRNILWISPADFQPAGINPHSWDLTNPRLPRGTKVRVEFEVTTPKHSLPPYGYLVVTPGPYPNAVSSTLLGNVSGTRGAVREYRFSAVVPMPADGHPVARIEIHPPRWADIPRGARWHQASLTYKAAGNYQVKTRATVANLSKITRTLTVFTGFIDSWEASTSTTSKNRHLIRIDATDVLALLSRRIVNMNAERGPEPLGERVDWLVGELDVDLHVSKSGVRDPDLARVPMQNRSALEVLHECASSAALSVWPSITPDGTVGIFFDDADARPAGDKLIIDSDGTARLSQLASTTLPASCVYKEGVSVRQDSTTVASQSRIYYLKELPDGTSSKQSITTGVEGPALLDVNTVLTNAQDAIEVGDAWLRRTPENGWTIQGISFNTKNAPSNLVAAVLNMNTRSACPITLSGLPTWIPAGNSERMIIEGVTLTARRNQWDIALILNRPTRAGVSITWQQLPAGLTWDKNTLTWSDTAGLTL